MAPHSSPETPRLYLDQPHRYVFDAVVTAHDEHNGRPSIILDRTLFYPESGGQLCDTGTLGDTPVVDVQSDSHGCVHHVLPAGSALPAVGQTLHGVIDVDRRRLHAALHTGQHLLSRAFIDLAHAETVSSRLGTSGATIDLDVNTLSDKDLHSAEDLVVSVIEADLGVKQWFPPESVLKTLSLRRAPKVTDNIRVVDIDGFDVSPCGGTHCAHTSQVGPLSITSVEKYKGKTRVTFLAGRAASTELRRRSHTLSLLGRSFTCGPNEVTLAIEKLRTELSAARSSLSALREREAQRLGDSLWAEAQSKRTATVVATVDSEPIESLRALGARITEHPGAVALIASVHDDCVYILAARGEGTGFDCGAFVKSVTTEHGGRGGGRADRAEGRWPRTPGQHLDWDAICSRE